MDHQTPKIQIVDVIDWLVWWAIEDMLHDQDRPIWEDDSFQTWLWFKGLDDNPEVIEQLRKALIERQSGFADGQKRITAQIKEAERYS